MSRDIIQAAIAYAARSGEAYELRVTLANGVKRNFVVDMDNNLVSEESGLVTFLNPATVLSVEVFDQG